MFSDVSSTPTLAANGQASLAERVFEAVKRDIVDFRLPPETILGEANVASQYQVSRAPAREALKRLASIGFVRAVPRVGYIVTSVSVHDFDEIFGLRLVLEPYAVQLAVPRLTDADEQRLQDLANAAGEIVRLPEEQQGTALSQVNSAFHRAIAHISGNRRLERQITALLDELERVMHMLAHSPSIDLVLDEHPVLLEQMRLGDAAAAAALMHEQLSHDYEVMRQLAVSPGGAGPLLHAKHN